MPIFKMVRIAVSVATLISCSCSCAVWADERLDPEMEPPDVTFPAGQPPAAAAVKPAAPANLSSPAAVGAAAKSATPTAPATVTAATSPAASATSEKPDPIAIIETEKGRIVIRLFRNLAPKTVANFIEIAGKGFYNGCLFHRVEPGFCVQTGDPHNNGSGVYIDPESKQIKTVMLEVNPQLKHNAAGVVAMARFPKNPNSASCQFYITLAPQPKLDGQYSIFGGVVQGMDVVNAIVKGDKMVSVAVQEITAN